MSDAWAILIVGVLTLIGVGVSVYAGFKQVAFQRVYERQATALSKINYHLYYVEGFAPGFMGKMLLEGESREENRKRFRDALRMANDEFAKAQVFLPEGLEGKLEEFFSEAVNAIIAVDAANLPSDADWKTNQWKEASDIIQKIPRLRKEILVEARRVLGLGCPWMNKMSRYLGF
jgi:hypothetical protein